MAEYECQYSDQVRKKHKSWHDGVLKYKNGQISLHAEDGTKLTTVRKSSKELERILDPGRFGEEQHLAARYVVTIESSKEQQRPSLALKMQPFKTPTMNNRPSRRRIPPRPRNIDANGGGEGGGGRGGDGHSARGRGRSRIRHVQTKPIVI